MKDGGRGVITVPHVVIYSTEEVSAEFDTPAVLPREQNPLICWLWESGGGVTGPFWRLWKGEKFLSPTEIHSTTARLSAINIFTVPAELSTVTRVSLFLGCHECL